MRKSLVTFFLLLFTFAILNDARTDEMNKLDIPVPFGAYLSWEIPDKLGKLNGVDRWTYIEKTLKLCSENNIDTIWVTNMSIESLPRLLKLCEKNNLLLLVSLSAIEGKIESRYANDMRHYKKVIPEAIKAAGDSKTLLGWVLSDEPLKKDLKRVEKLHQMFKKLDPNRIFLVVTMAGDSPYVPKQTSFDIVCGDIYPFFGPNDPNGPHTPKNSIEFFRSNTEKYIHEMAAKGGVAWSMTQCFVEIWGPRVCKNGRYYALKGAYLHWRAPTLAELRWQIWESFRAGAKGTICFQLPPICGADPKDALLPEPDVKWKDVLVKGKTDAGYAGLLGANFEPTDAFKQLSETYKKIKAYSDIIKKWEFSDKNLLTVELPGKIQCFYLKDSKQHYAIVVNDDFEKKCRIKIILNKSVNQMNDLLSHKRFVLTKNNSDSKKAYINLPAGEGTIIKIDIEK